MSIRPSLAHDASPDAYAEAMVKCQGYAPSCSDAGECLHDGVCFTSSGRGFKAARRVLAALVEAESDVSTRVWLKLSLDALDHHQWLARGAIDALRVVAINKRVREEYGGAGQPPQHP
jgi:hypothetical protein